MSGTPLRITIAGAGYVGQANALDTRDVFGVDA